MYDILWRDVLEIIFFAALFYYLTLWLKKDKTKNLLPYFYGYCLVAFCAHVLELTTITSFLFLFTPAAVMLFILMHQDTLQRNIVALKHITAKPISTHNWLETLLRTCLVALNNNKEILCIIEHTDDMKPFINTPSVINAQLTQDLLALLLESSLYDPQKMIWVSSNGQLHGINATWQSTSQTSAPTLSWHNEAVLYTQKTDALVVHLDQTNGTFTLISNGIIHEKLSAHHVFGLIKKQIQYQFSLEEKGIFYGTPHKNRPVGQRTP